MRRGIFSLPVEELTVNLAGTRCLRGWGRPERRRKGRGHHSGVWFPTMAFHLEKEMSKIIVKKAKQLKLKESYFILPPYFVVKKSLRACSTEISTSTHKTARPNKLPLDRDGSENSWHVHSPLCSSPAWLTYYRRKGVRGLDSQSCLTPHSTSNPPPFFLLK